MKNTTIDLCKMIITWKPIFKNLPKICIILRFLKIVYPPCLWWAPGRRSPGQRDEPPGSRREWDVPCPGRTRPDHLRPSPWLRCGPLRGSRLTIPTLRSGQCGNDTFPNSLTPGLPLYCWRSLDQIFLVGMLGVDVFFSAWLWSSNRLIHCCKKHTKWHLLSKY